MENLIKPKEVQTFLYMFQIFPKILLIYPKDDPICLEYCRLLSHRFWLMSLLLGVIRQVRKKKKTKTKSFSLTFKSHLFIQYLCIKCLAKLCNYFLESPIAREKFWNFFLIKLFLLASVNK